MMKRYNVMLLAAVLLLLTACGGPAPGGTGATPPPSGEPAPASAPPSTSRPTGGKPSVSHDGTIEETVLLEQDGVKITATGLAYTEYSADLSLLLENDSGQDLSFRSGTMGYSCNSVNGYMTGDGYLNTDVPAGKKAKETISFDLDELLILGITEIADIEIGFDIQNSDNDTYLLPGPLSLKTPLADSYDYTVSTYQQAVSTGQLSSLYDFTLDYYAEDVVYDQCGVRVTSLALLTNKKGETALLLEAENTSEGPVSIATQQFYLNGLLVQEGIWDYDTITSGKRRLITVPLSRLVESSYREPLGLTELGSAAFSVELKDADGNPLAGPEELSITLPDGPASFNGEGAVLYEGEGIRLICKGLLPDEGSYSDDIHMLLLAENSGTAPVVVQVDSGSVSVNGFMTSVWGVGDTVEPGRCTLVDLELRGDSLDGNGITEIAEITNIEASFEVRDKNYNTLAEFAITYTAAPGA